ncbi:MAG: hypothetical protein WC393_01580 [Candidatus Nanoarchaeia archaeon]|jgi:hypothetical protein
MNKINLDDYFFKYYGLDYSISKIVLFKSFIDNFEKMFPFIQGKDGFNFKDKKSLIDNFKLEIHFCKYHTLENFFALIFGLIQEPENVWKWVINYKPQKFNEMIKLVSKNGLSSISGLDENNTICNLIYTHCPKEFIQQVDSQKSITNISIFFKKCANELINKEDYNSYKHGLRIIKGDIEAECVNKNNEILDKIHSSAVSYLSKNDKLIMQLFSYERDYNIIIFCWQVLRIILHQHNITLTNELKELKIIDISKVDIEGLFKSKEDEFFIHH